MLPGHGHGFRPARSALSTLSALLLLAALSAGCGTRGTVRRDVAAAASGAATATAAEVAAGRKGPIIALTDTILDTGGTDTVRFGRLRSGEIAVMRIWLANETTRPVAIASYDRSCGCTSLEFDSEPVKAGDARAMKLAFDSRGLRGWQLKVLDIRLAGGRKSMRLFIEAEVE